MTLSIRSPEAESLARRLAQLDETTITQAVVLALKEAVHKRAQMESPSESARRILSRRGLAFKPGRKPVPEEVWHELDHDFADRG